MKVPRRVLDEMNAEEAAQLAVRSEQFQKVANDRTIDGFKFHSEPGCDASIKFHGKIRDKVKIENKMEC